MHVLRPLSIAFVSTHPPRECGIATFTSDLARAIKAADPTVRLCWAAINEPGSIHPYGPEVRWRIRQKRPASYREAGEQINDSRVDVVSLEHEFQLYGIWRDPDLLVEDHLPPFLEALRKPLVTTLHTVPPDPSPSVLESVQRIGQRSNIVVAMAELARQLLVDSYRLEATKVVVVPHGMPAVERKGRRQMKQRLSLQGRTIISTFGLVDPRKGLEYMIKAMEPIVERHPETLYLVVGRTHPELVRRDGETYRNQLYDLVDSLGLEQHVAFVDEYLSQREIMDYLLASDVYVTPYLDPNQITSGTLSYALGAGKAIVSTPYLHATEALGDGRGVLVEFRSEQSLADAILRILEDPEHKRQLEQNAYEYGHKMTWPQVGAHMLEIFKSVARINGQSETDAVSVGSGASEYSTRTPVAAARQA